MLHGPINVTWCIEMFETTFRYFDCRSKRACPCVTNEYIVLVVGGREMGTLVWESRTPVVGNNRNRNSLHWMSGVSNTIWEQYTSPSNGTLPLEREFVYFRTKTGIRLSCLTTYRIATSSDGNKNKVKYDEFVGWKICESEIRCFQGKMSLLYVPYNRYVGSSYNLIAEMRCIIHEQGWYIGIFRFTACTRAAYFLVPLITRKESWRLNLWQCQECVELYLHYHALFFSTKY